MPHPALQLAGLQATIDPAALAKKQVRVAITGGILRISDQAIAALVPPNVVVERISNGRIFVKTRVPVSVIVVDVALEIRPAIGPRGRIVFELVNFRAGFLSVPPFVVAGFLASQVRGKPGVHIAEDNQIQIDLAEVLGPLGITLPAPRALGADGGILEIAF